MLYFIINPKARTGVGASTWAQIQQELLRRGTDYKAYQTKYAGHARKIARELTSGLTEDISLNVIGGDGTINEVLEGIRNFDKVIFGYIPTGSGNDFARSMGIPSEPLEALDCIIRRSALSSINVGYVETNEKHQNFGISCGIGFDAAVCLEAQSSPVKKYLNKFHLGKLTYLIIALKQLILCHPTSMTIHMDGHRTYRFRKTYFAAIMNQRYEGGGFQMCPKASPKDGVLDVLVISDMSKLKILVCLPTAFFGKHDRFKGVHIFRCKRISIECPIPLSVHKDGEFSSITTELSAGLEKNTLKVIVPE